MRRWHNEVNRMIQRTKFRVAWESIYFPAEQSVEKIGRFRKRHPMDCGHSHCGMCHSEKYEPKNRANKRRQAIEDQD